MMNLNGSKKLKSWLDEELKYGYVPNLNYEHLKNILNSIILWYSPTKFQSEFDCCDNLFELFSYSLTDEELSFLKCENLDISIKNTENKINDLKQNLIVNNNLFNILLRNKIIDISIEEIIKTKTIFEESGIDSANNLIDSFKKNLCYYDKEYINYEVYSKTIK